MILKNLLFFFPPLLIIISFFSTQNRGRCRISSFESFNKHSWEPAWKCQNKFRLVWRWNRCHMWHTQSSFQLNLWLWRERLWWGRNVPFGQNLQNHPDLDHCQSIKCWQENQHCIVSFELIKKDFFFRWYFTRYFKLFLCTKNLQNHSDQLTQQVSHQNNQVM